MIKNSKALSMVEVMEFLKEDKENLAEIIGFIKKFSKMKLEKAKELRQEIEKLDLMKVKEEQIAKIIDLMPDNAEDLNKIFVDVGLNEDEIKKILDAIKKFK